MDLLDTSVVVAAFTAEAHSERALQFISSNSSHLCITPWVGAEFSAALSGKQRAGGLSYADRLASLRLFDRMGDLVFKLIDIERTDFEDAARLCEDVGLNLRAPDALHAAVALREGMRLVTFDKKLVRAAGLIGLAVVTP